MLEQHTHCKQPEVTLLLYINTRAYRKPSEMTPILSMYDLRTSRKKENFDGGKISLAGLKYLGSDQVCAECSTVGCRYYLINMPTDVATVKLFWNILI